MDNEDFDVWADAPQMPDAWDTIEAEIEAAIFLLDQEIAVEVGEQQVIRLH